MGWAVLDRVVRGERRAGRVRGLLGGGGGGRRDLERQALAESLLLRGEQQVAVVRVVLVQVSTLERCQGGLCAYAAGAAAGLRSHCEERIQVGEQRGHGLGQCADGVVGGRRGLARLI